MFRSPASLGLWDGEGHRVVELPADSPVGYGTLSFLSWLVADVCGDARDELLVIKDGRLRIYTQG